MKKVFVCLLSLIVKRVKIMRKQVHFLISILLIICILLIPCNVSAENAENNSEEASYFQYKIEEYEGEMAAIITGGNAAEIEKEWGCINIPKKIDGYPVRVIDECAFKNESSLAHIVLAEGIKEIRAGAFQGCTELRIINIGRTVTTIHETAFEGCARDIQIITYEDTYAQQFAEEQGIRCEIEKYLQYEGLEQGLYSVSISDTTLSDKDVEIKVSVTTEGEEFDALTSGIEQNAVLYEISMQVDGKEVQPKGGANIIVRIPDNICGYYSSTYRVGEDGTLSEEGGIGGPGIGYARHQLAHFLNVEFGKFMIVGPNSFGDMDGDGEVTAKDALIVLKATVLLENLSSVQHLTADVDGDGKTAVNDALCILMKAVRLQELPIIRNVAI